jgi:hypothetical protein
MNYIKTLPRIKKLARRVGTPLKSISFDDGGVKFTFVVEGETSVSFPDADAGVQQVIGWLEEMLPEEYKSLKEEDNTVLDTVSLIHE